MAWKDELSKNLNPEVRAQNVARVGKYIEYLNNQFQQKGVKGLNIQELKFILKQSQGM